MRAKSRRIWFVVGFFLIVSFSFFVQPFILSEAMAADKVTLRLNWKVGGEHVPFIVAMGKGFYTEEGIDISIKEGAGSSPTLQLMGSGKETFGICGNNLTMAGIAKGVKVIQIMLIMAKNNYGIVSKAESGIKEPKDLIGKTVAGSGSGGIMALNVLLDMNNIPRDKVKYLSAGKAHFEATVTGRSDGSLCLPMNALPRIAKMGLKNPSLLVFSDFGVAKLAPGVITHLNTYENNPDLIRRFVKASIRGMQHMYMDLEKTADIVLQHFPMTDREVLIAGLENMLELCELPIGWQSMEDGEKIRDFVVNYSGVSEAKDMPMSKFFTNEFLPY